MRIVTEDADAAVVDHTWVGMIVVQLGLNRDTAGMRVVVSTLEDRVLCVCVMRSSGANRTVVHVRSSRANRAVVHVRSSGANRAVVHAA